MAEVFWKPRMMPVLPACLAAFMSDAADFRISIDREGSNIRYSFALKKQGQMMTLH